MPNKEQLSILKNGVDVWNGWRAKNIYVYADLNEADLNEADLRQADLRISHLRRANLFRVDLRGADLTGADLSDADLREANLSEADLTKANLKGASLGGAFVKGANFSQANLLAANLRNANFSHTNLSSANLMVANLERANLDGTNLSKANFTKADLAGISLCRADMNGARFVGANLVSANLVEAKFIDTDLTGADFVEASIGNTVFVNSDLSKATGLESLDHRGPSHISINTFALSNGKLPEVFLRGCGLRDADIEYAKLSDLHLSREEAGKILSKIHDLRTLQAQQMAPLFISCSHADAAFVSKLERRLNEKGIRSWRDVHGIKIGRTEKSLDRAVYKKPKVLLILSRDSITSNWMEHEVGEVKKLEKELGCVVLYPLALDDRWKDSRAPKGMMEHMREYNILDFSGWKTDRKFEDVLAKLIDGLGLFAR
jgi:uncharacterized protein YjbI with pentapeptide repeats